MGCAISPSGFPQIFSVKNRFFLYAAPAERGARTAAGVFALTGRLLFSAPAERGARTAAGVFALTWRLLSLHRLTGVRELPQACSP